jgi:hypothetical protein
MLSHEFQFQQSKNAKTPNTYTASSWTNGSTCQAGVEDPNPRHQATKQEANIAFLTQAEAASQLVYIAVNLAV